MKKILNFSGSDVPVVGKRFRVECSVNLELKIEEPAREQKTVIKLACHLI